MILLKIFRFVVPANMWPVEPFCGNYCGVVVPIVSTITFAAVSYSAFKFLFHGTSQPDRPYRQRHNWQSIKASARVSNFHN